MKPLTALALFRHSLCGLAFVALAGCASTPPLSEDVSPNLTVVDALPPVAGVDPVTGLPPTPLGPYDTVSYEVQGIEGLRGDVVVDGQGMVSIPVAGRFRAAGLQIDQLEAVVIDGLRRNFVRDPQVSINLKEMVSQRVTVEGAVARPGTYPIIPHMSLLTALASSQGTSEFANSNVVVFRSVGGSRYATLYNLRAIRSGQYDDPAIFPNDVVVVGESSTARTMQKLLAAAGGVLSPLTVLLTSI